MTEDLRDLLRERAEGADLQAPDLGAISTTGRRRARRHRGVLIAAAGVAVALAAAGSLALTAHRDAGGNDGGPATASDEGIPTTGITWASGSTLHVGDRTYDLGHPVTAYVRTSVGYLFTDSLGAVWSATGGTIEQVGTTSSKQVHLVADQSGALAGWVDVTGSRPSFEILDQTSGSVLGVPSARGTTGASDRGTGAWFEALDGDTAYWRDAGGETVLDSFKVASDSEDSALSTSKGTSREHVLAAAGDTQVLAGNGDALTLRGSDGSTLALAQVYGSEAQLSPDGRYANVDADSPAVYDTLTGTKIALDFDGFFADGYQWLDDHTLAVLALATKKSDYQLLTCTIPDATCTVAVPHLGQPYDENIDAVPSFTLPIGVSLGE